MLVGVCEVHHTSSCCNLENNNAEADNIELGRGHSPFLKALRLQVADSASNSTSFGHSKLVVVVKRDGSRRESELIVLQPLDKAKITEHGTIPEIKHHVARLNIPVNDLNVKMFMKIEQHGN